MNKTRYTVKIRLARWGAISSVMKETLQEEWPSERWMGWEPEPTYWRPTWKWALSRARRKKERLEDADARMAAIQYPDTPGRVEVSDICDSCGGYHPTGECP